MFSNKFRCWFIGEKWKIQFCLTERLPHELEGVISFGNTSPSVLIDIKMNVQEGIQIVL